MVQPTRMCRQSAMRRSPPVRASATSRPHQRSFSTLSTFADVQNIKLTGSVDRHGPYLAFCW
jgi:hypothetical protein